MISITSSDNILIPSTKKIAHQWGFIYSSSPTSPFFLQLTPQGLQLVQTTNLQNTNSLPSPIRIDFSSGSVAHRRIFGGGKGQTIAKAVGLNKLPIPIILDATAGMGKDAFIFASLGAKVILMERSPIVAALLNDALNRGLKNEEIAPIIQRMQLLHDDARYMNDTTFSNIRPDIIYLDPMFPHKKKSALVKKEMLAFQQIIGSDSDSDQLLNICQQIAHKRVVVKRPIKAPFLDNTTPSFSMKMKKHRFDIYISNNNKPA
ncbi:MAG: class I SAM-dependent methyltransferase [Gammaproteobacteria bacterium]|nr:class I SAM-dependent methyltransferase [Gammaproteobacteria bacterium]